MIERDKAYIDSLTADQIRAHRGTDSPGYLTTLAACRKYDKPFLLVEEGVTRPSEVRDWLAAHRVGVLNVAGDRESRNPGHGRWVEAFLRRAFAGEQKNDRQECL